MNIHKVTIVLGPQPGLSIIDIPGSINVNGTKFWLLSRGAAIMQGADQRASWYDVLPVWRLIEINHSTVTLVTTPGAKLCVWDGFIGPADQLAVAAAAAAQPSIIAEQGPATVGAPFSTTPDWLVNGTIAYESTVNANNSYFGRTEASSSPIPFFYDGAAGGFSIATLSNVNMLNPALVSTRTPPPLLPYGNLFGSVTRGINMTAPSVGRHFYARATDGGAGIHRSGIAWGGALTNNTVIAGAGFGMPFIVAWAQGLTYGAAGTSGSNCSAGAIQFDDATNAPAASLATVTRAVGFIITPDFSYSGLSFTVRLGFHVPALRTDPTMGLVVMMLSTTTSIPGIVSAPSAWCIHNTAGGLPIPFTKAQPSGLVSLR